MPELLIIVPSRGRPQNIVRLLGAVHDLAELETGVYIGVDEDDPKKAEYEQVFDKYKGKYDRLGISSPKGLAEWTNFAAKRHADRYPFLASFGDDHLPRTRGFDRRLIRAIQDMGGTGFSYPYDGIREDVPEAWVQSSDIVRELGYMCPPGLKHFYIDNVIADLGRWAGCIRYCRAVKVEHIHPATGKAASDPLYAKNFQKVEEDKRTYNEWRSTRMISDARKICALRDVCGSPAR